jgi:hypothetical protein
MQTGRTSGFETDPLESPGRNKPEIPRTLFWISRRMDHFNLAIFPEPPDKELTL